MRRRHGDKIERRLVWILGSGRSGSTWLMNLLRACGDVVHVNEPLIGAHLAASTAAITGDGGAPTIYEASRTRSDYVFADDSKHIWAPALRRLILDRLHHAAASGSRTSLVVVKEPNGSVAAPLLMSLMPASRLVFLVRDGRDVVDSAVDAVGSAWGSAERRPRVFSPQQRTDILDHQCRRWVDATTATQAAFDAHDPARRILVRYEDLRGDTAGEMARVLDWLGRRVDDVDAIVAPLAFEAVPDEAKGPGKFHRSARPGLWRENLTEDEQRRVADLLGPTLERVGYV